MPTLYDAISQFTRQHEPRREVISGWMADPEGYGDPIVRDETTGDPTGYYYCMIDRGDGTNSGDVIKVWGGGIRPVAGWPVQIGTTRERPWELSILAIDREAMGGAINKYPHKTEPHHETHEWGDPSGSDDVVYPRWLQLYDFSVWPVPGTRAVTVADGVYDPSGHKVDFPYTTVSLEDYAPSGTNTSRWVIVCLDPTGVVQIYPCPSGTNLTIEDICQVPYADWWELAAVKLWQNDTSLNMIPGYEEIIDLRFSRVGFPQHGGLGSGTNWENVIIVAKSGGDYSVIQDAENAAEALDLLLVMPGWYYEDVVIDTHFLGIEAIGNRFKDYLHTHNWGAGNTGPIFTLSEDCAIIDFGIGRTLTGGSGRFIGVDAGNTGYVGRLTDCRVEINAGATGRAVSSVKISGDGTVPGTLDRCYIIEVNGGAGSYAVECAGNTVELSDCKITGDIVATAATTLILRNCFVDGDVTGMAGSDLYLDQGTYVSGTISGWDSTTYRPAGGTIANHDHTGDPGDGGQLDHGAALTGLADDDHTQYALNWDNVLIVSAAGGTRTPGFYTSIATALAAASSGDVVLVLPGTYSVSALAMVNGVSLIGIDRENTILDGPGTNASYAISLTGSVSGCLISNLTLRNTGASVTTLWAALSTTTGTNYFDNVDFVVVNTGGTGAYGISVLTGAATLYLENIRSSVTGASLNVDIHQNQASSNVYCRRVIAATISRIQGTMHMSGCAYTTGPASADATREDAQPILDALLTVDGDGSGLDADTVDGLETSADPGAAAKILKTTAAGLLTLQDLTIDGLLRVDGAADAGIFRLAETALSLDFTGTAYDTKAECNAVGMRFSDSDTPFPDGGFLRTLAGTWSHSAGNGWYATVASGDTVGPAILIPITRPHEWQIDVTFVFTHGSTNRISVDIASMTPSNHTLGGAISRKTNGAVNSMDCELFANDGDDTWTTQETGTSFTMSGGDRVYKLRHKTATIGVYGPGDAAWVNWTGHIPTAGISYTPTYVYIQVSRYGTSTLETHYIKNLTLKYLL